MRALRMGLVLVLTVASLVIAPAPALAAAPPTGPMTVRASYGFETAYPSDLTTALYPYIPGSYITPQYLWGRNANAKRSGSYSLWCAGANGAADNSFMYSLGYDYNTGGFARLSLPQLADYYSASLEFWYLLPSRGVADTYSFRSSFGPDANSANDYATQYEYPIVSSWTRSTHDITAEKNAGSLSRTAGVFKWLFINFDEGGGAYATPTEGIGASIDDVVVTGYMYGPVRSVTATSVPTGLKLDWKRPYRAIGSTTLEERTISYRVWRQPQTAPTDPWTELTESGRVTTTGENVTYTDTTAVGGVLYRYLVIPYEGTTGTGYGEMTEVTGRRAAALGSGISLSMDAARYTLAASQATTLTYAITNTGDVDLTGIALTVDGATVNGTSGTLAAHQSMVVQSAYTAPEDAGFHVFDAAVTGDAGGLTVDATSSVGVQVNTPRMTVAVSPASRGVSAGKQAAYRVSVTNTGDVALDVSGTMARGATPPTALSAATVAPGSTATLWGHVTAASTVGSVSAIDVDVTGTCGAGTDWERTIAGSGAGSATVVSPRFAGASRTATAVELSKAAFPGGASSVVIATAYGYADALSAAALASSLGGPLLLVKADSVPAEVLMEISRLHATSAYVIGGTSVVGDTPRNQLTAAGLTVIPVAGASRYATAAEVAKRVDALSTSKTVFLATGTNFPDALAASSLAAAMKAPILLTQPASLPAETLAELRAFAPTRVVVCGGTGAVSDSVLSTIRSELGLSVANTPRLAGAGRYETAKKIIEWGRDTAGLAPDGIDGMYLASGTNYPDALAGGVFAAHHLGRWRPLMLTNPATADPVPEVQALVVGNPSLGFVSAIGGTSALPEPLYAKALGYLQ